MMKADYSDTPSALDHSEFDNAKGHLQDWSQALINFKGRRGLDMEDLLCIQELNMDRNATYARLQSMGLPTVPNQTCSLLQFLSYAEEYLANFTVCKIRLVVEPFIRKEVLPTIRMTDPIHSEVVEILNSKIRNEDQNAYSILIKEYIPFAYRVTIVVNSDQSILLEAAKPSSHSFQLNGVPDYYVRREPFLGTFKYDFEDRFLRTLLYQAIMKIPYIGTGHHKEFHEGYYEMIIAKRHESAPYQFFFDDYRRGKGFNQ